jgi:hypothetical protein
MEVRGPLCPWLAISLPLFFLLVFLEAILGRSIRMVLEESVGPYSQ